jgi:hypothetical protein
MSAPRKPEPPWAYSWSPTLIPEEKLQYKICLQEDLVRGFVITPWEITKGNTSKLLEASWNALIHWLLMLPKLRVKLE